MTLAIKTISLILLGLALVLLEGFWLQSIIQHFGGQFISVVACIAIVVVIAALTPRTMSGLLLLSLFIAQCWIWII
jgi:hypothetical protein